MEGRKVVFYDLETGGLDPARHPVIQFAGIATLVHARGEGLQFDELEALERKILFDVAEATTEALEVNSYDPEVWGRLGCSSSSVCREVGAFFKRHATTRKVARRSGRPYYVAESAAHNGARFDHEFLKEWFRREDQFLPAAFLTHDTLQLARWIRTLLPDAGLPESLSVEALAEHFGIEYIAHDALGDVRATIEITRRLSVLLRKVGL